MMNAWPVFVGIGIILAVIVWWKRGRRYPQPRKTSGPLILTRQEEPRPQSASIPELSQMARELGTTYSEHDRAANRYVREMMDRQ
jgi:hypothetical protein